EMRQSTRILAQALERIPDGPVNIADHRVVLPPKSKATSDMESMIHHFKQVMEGPRPPIGEAYVAVESPKGEKGYYMVSDGTSKPVRWRIRPPSFVNLSAISKMAEVARLLEITPAYVKGVVTFYTMYHQHPVGRYFVQVCTTSPCQVCGAEEVVDAFLRHTGCQELGVTSPDDKFTVIEVECLGA